MSQLTPSVVSSSPTTGIKINGGDGGGDGGYSVQSTNISVSSSPSIFQAAHGITSPPSQ